MSDPLVPQASGLSLTDLLLVGAVVLVAVIYLYRKLRPRPGKPACASCPSERRCPLSEGRCEDPERGRR
ncbi:hypothetical protein TVNIR_0585 [Thioalkalivibrio nitratireducens DSM 14787]|uniref:FeoB-associated Cys-rich membrane protein n=1 Tax=Thioalkalivibrio nitratireducens (strain DSM 14787 / UNIQEM 213 / ALEN2) TaxID=1255043 RepID=L0DV95_THIND|nr:hypothetical protein [Thioalkalivibrio nitratireducens]AGA32286.1 hypothetical protein TVNIR_0585 [Thioalkalivibrio nitratireducens DSM 14787]